MIDLHLHLDGSLSAGDVKKFALRERALLPDGDLKKLLSVGDDCANLTEYLQKFSLPLKFLQTEENISDAVFSLIERLNKGGLIYAEIRFAPQLHSIRGLTQSEVVLSAIDGLNRGMKKYPMGAQLILCCMRGGEESENRETLSLAEKYLGGGVCAADLAGDESSFPTRDFKYIFAEAKSRGVPLTIHAGEAGGAEDIEFAVKNGAARIGHGIRAVYDRDVMNLIKDEGVLLENCITSNLQTRAAKSFGEYPLPEFLKAGIRACLNTDNMTVSGTNLLKEYGLARKLGIDDSGLLAIALNAAEGAFLRRKEKEELKLKVREGFTDWINKTGGII